MNRYFFSKVIKVLSITLLVLCSSVSYASNLNPSISVTRTKNTYPTTLNVHIFLDEAEDTDKVKAQIFDNATGNVIGYTTLSVGTYKKNLNGRIYINYPTSHEFTEAESSTKYVLDVKLLNSTNEERGTSSIYVIPKEKEQGESKLVVNSSSGNNKTINDTTYTYLEPLPGFGSSFDITKSGAISNYIGTLFKLILGIMGVIAVFEIIQLGLKTMSNSFTQKKFAKERLRDIIMALIIALCSVLVLKTINPKLVDFNFGIKPIVIGIDERLRVELEKNTNPDKSSSYKMVGTFENPKGTNDKSYTSNSLAGDLKKGATLKKFTVYVTNKRGCFTVIDGGKTYAHCVNINIGMNGYSAQGKGTDGDKKTPLGTHKILGNIQLPQKNVAAKTIGGGNVNLGAAFLGLSIDGKSAARGIGIHGDANNCIVSCPAYSYTEGCIKMSNDDLVLLAPYMVRDKIDVIVTDK